MRKALLCTAIVLGGFLSSFAQVIDPGGDECPDRCKTASVICCTTNGGSTYYGFISSN